MRTSATYFMDGLVPDGVCVSLDSESNQADLEFRGRGPTRPCAHYIHIHGLTAETCEFLGKRLILAAKELRKTKVKARK